MSKHIQADFKPSALGPIPNSWDVSELGEVCTLNNGRAYKLTEWEKTGTPVIRLQNLTGSGNNYYYSSLKLPDNQYVYPGDLLYMWSASFGPYIWNGPKAIYHYHIWKMSCNQQLQQNYLYHVLGFMTESWKSGTNGSTMLHLTKESMERVYIKLPTLPEQQKIAAVLSSADRSIAATEKLIAKLADLKKALMQQLLTKGIGHTEFKPSPLGPIPKSWEVVEFEYVAKIQGGYAFKSTDAVNNGTSV